MNRRQKKKLFNRKCGYRIVKLPRNFQTWALHPVSALPWCIRSSSRKLERDVPYTLTHDRDVEFMVDKADVDETNATASIQNISRVFEQTWVVPETDALFFSKVAQAAQKTEGYHGSTAASTYTKAKVFGMLKDILAKGKLRRYKANGSLIMYVTSQIMDALEQSTEFTRKIEMTQIAEGGMGIETRVTEIDGVPIMEVIDDERFYDAFDWEPEGGGFAPLKKVEAASGVEAVTGAHKINVLVACGQTCKTVPKINSIYYFEPGGHRVPAYVAFV